MRLVLQLVARLLVVVALCLGAATVWATIDAYRSVDRATAEVVLSALLASVGGGEIFLDVPSINRNAVALAQDLGLVPVFETARMYTGAIPPLRLERVFGVTTFELG